MDAASVWLILGRWGNKRFHFPPHPKMARIWDMGGAGAGSKCFPWLRTVRYLNGP